MLAAQSRRFFSEKDDRRGRYGMGVRGAIVSEETGSLAVLAPATATVTIAMSNTKLFIGYTFTRQRM